VAWSSTPVGLASLFAVGLLVRLVLAGGGGFPFDMSSFAGWAGRLADRGPWSFYPRGGDKFFVDYPPGYLYVLWGIGRLTRALGSGAPSVFWLKLPPILADLGLAWLISELAVRLAPASLARRMDVRGPAAAAILLNPAVFFISAVWGQVDVFLAVLVVAGLLLLGTGAPTFRREAGGIALLAVAVGTKPQAAFALPMVVLFLVWRHVRSRLVEQAHIDSRVRVVGGGLVRMAALAIVGAAAGLVLLAPFRLGPAAAFDFYAKASSTYSVTSVFAFNGWGIVGFWRPDSGADAFKVFGVPAFAVGLALFSFGGALVCARAWQSLRTGEDEGRVLVFGSAAVTLVGFAVLTRVHERYLFLPLALLAAFFAVRWLKRAFIVLSALYLINVFFPYVYYLKYVGRPAPTLGGLTDSFYGAVGSAQMRILSAVTAGACLYIAGRGWHAIEAPVVAEPLPTIPAEVVRAVRPARWSLRMHDVGRRGAVIAIVAFAVAMLTRLPGLGHPPGMYFDEVYHARTGAEYIANKEVFEWTHPPLAKELISYSMRAFSSFGARPGGDLPQGLGSSGLTSGPESLAWVERSGPTARVRFGTLSRTCGLKRTDTLPPVTFDPKAIAFDGGPVFLAGQGDEGAPELLRLDSRGERWRAPLPEDPDAVVALGDRAFVRTTGGVLVYVSATGKPKVLAAGVAGIAAERSADPRRAQTSGADRVVGAIPRAASREGVVWTSFPADSRVAAWDADGARVQSIDVPGSPRAITAPDRTERLIVSTGSTLSVIDSKSNQVSSTIKGRASLLASVPETEIAWAARGKQLRAIEPRSGVVIGRATIARPPTSVVADPIGHRLVAVTSVGLECAAGRPQLAWRLGSAVFGSLMVAVIALIALRLFGNVWLAGLASLFMTVEGLGFTMSRIAIPESYTTAFLLAAWFCALSALYRCGDESPHRSRAAALGWLAATGLLGGAAAASKWVAVYGFAAICLLIIWDGLRRGRDGIWGIAGGPGLSMFVLAVCLLALPLFVYVITYIPYLELGHSFGELFRLQGQMFGYHANLDATHPFSSPWYGWPFGYRAVFLYLGGSGAMRSEIWTIPNLVVFWGGLLGMAALARRARQARDAVPAVIVFAALMQYVPWIAVGRVIFIYHYLPVVPFLAIALAWLLTEDLRDSRFRYVIGAAVTTAAVLFFVGVLPMLEGWSMPVAYLDAVRNAFSWVIP
jgi:predicted membrane-bound dolichyl-phosphate-mannose-protein mannosyltransferase